MESACDHPYISWGYDPSWAGGPVLGSDQYERGRCAECNREFRAVPRMTEQPTSEQFAALTVTIERVRALLSKPSPPRYNSTGGYIGLLDGDPDEHRTVGDYRAWCHPCGEWCYPTIPCRCCEPPVDASDLRAALGE